MAVLFVFLFSGGVAGILLAIHLGRARVGTRALRELRSLPVTTIAAAREGRVKLSGVARAAQTETSVVGQIRCIALRRVMLSQTPGGRTVTQRYERAFPFELDDGSGTVVVDPAGSTLDLEILQTLGKGSFLMEEVIRDSDTVVVLGDIAPSSSGSFSFLMPPLISWRSIPEAIPALLIPWGQVISGLALLAGLSGIVHSLVTGDALDREILLGSAGLVTILAVVFGIRIKLSDND